MPAAAHRSGPGPGVDPASTGVDGHWISAEQWEEYVDLRGRERRRARQRRVRADNPFMTGRRVVSMLSSVLPRLAEHVAIGSVSGQEVGQLVQSLGAISDTAVRQLRDQGYSWAEVGACFGLTKQGAQQRWGRDRGIG